MKKFLPVLLVTLLISSLFFQTFATNSSSTPSDTMVSVREVGESLGYKVTWNSKTKSATIKDANLSVAVSPDNPICTLSNESRIHLKKAPSLIDGVLFVPIEFWARTFGLDVKMVNGNLTIKKAELSNPSDLLDDIITPLVEGTNKVYTPQKLGITLTENPSTGYTWHVEFPEGIEVISDNFTESPSDLLGANGTRYWITRATKPGTYTLIFNKSRVSDISSPVESKKFILEVTDFKIPTN